MPWFGKDLSDPNQVAALNDPIAQIDQSVIDRRVLVGRDERNRPMYGKVPSRVSAKMLCDDGSEADVPLVNGRVATPESWQRYGLAHVRGLLRQGYLPK